MLVWHPTGAMTPGAELSTQGWCLDFFLGTYDNGMSTVLSQLQFMQSSSIHLPLRRRLTDPEPQLGHDLTLIDDLMFSTGTNLFTP